MESVCLSISNKIPGWMHFPTLIKNLCFWLSQCKLLIRGEGGVRSVKFSTCEIWELTQKCCQEKKLEICVKFSCLLFLITAWDREGEGGRHWFYQNPKNIYQPTSISEEITHLPEIVQEGTWKLHFIRVLSQINLIKSRVPVWFHLSLVGSFKMIPKKLYPHKNP